MSIDVENENLITLMQASRLFPPDGKSPATMARWIQRGVNGVKLATIVIGGRRLTSQEAVRRFIAAQNADESPTPTIKAWLRSGKWSKSTSTQKTLFDAGASPRETTKPASTESGHGL